MTTIELISVDVTLNNHHILKNINTTFESQSITAIIGPSGSGKTTLIKLINGLISPSNGDILFNNKNIINIDILKLRQQTGMALQSAPMIHGTVYDNLNLPFKLHQEQLNKDKALELLDDLGLNLKLDEPVKNLSGGQRQRLSIARTLLNNPKVLLLDEITSSLDPKSIRDVEKLIHNIHEKYKPTILWITHNVEQAERATERYLLLKDGQVIHNDLSKNIKSSANKSVQQFLEGEFE